MSRILLRSLVIAAFAVAILPGRAYASLTTFATYSGNVGYSSDGFGSLDQSGTISASVPVGSTVLAAYLYTSTWGNSTHIGVSSTLNGNPVTYGAPVPNTDVCCGLASARADVTAIVAAVVNGGPGGIYNFTVTEGDTSSQDGEALVVVYSNPLLPTATVAILDGFSAASGDNFTVNLGTPVAPGFFGEMILGIGFSCCSFHNPAVQSSTVSVNGTTITDNAGMRDDGTADSNGTLITVGGFDDAFSAHLPTYANDHERYNLVPYVTNGDTSITVFTNNPSNDDNIFMATFYVSGVASVTTVPDGAETILLLGLGLAVLGVATYRRS